MQRRIVNRGNESGNRSAAQIGASELRRDGAKSVPGENAGVPAQMWHGVSPVPVQMWAG
jgi:hypothetical protein